MVSADEILDKTLNKLWSVEYYPCSEKGVYDYQNVKSDFVNAKCLQDAYNLACEKFGLGITNLVAKKVI